MLSKKSTGHPSPRIECKCHVCEVPRNLFIYRVGSHSQAQAATPSKEQNSPTSSCADEDQTKDKQTAVPITNWFSEEITQSTSYINWKEAPAVLPRTTGSTRREGSKQYQEEPKVFLLVCQVFLQNQDWCWTPPQLSKDADIRSKEDGWNLISTVCIGLQPTQVHRQRLIWTVP